MANPLEAFRKIRGRSLKELRTRTEQAVAARAEQIGLSGRLISDARFSRLIDRAALNGKSVTAANLFEKFYTDARSNFFAAFRQQDQITEICRNQFPENAAAHIENAEKIVGGKFDLLGYRDLDFGAPVDWHYEPLTGKRPPLKHWKQFDELSTTETGDRKIFWELNRHQYFFTLGAAFRLTGDERYAETFTRHLNGWMAANPPGRGINWSSSLEVSLRVISWVWALHLFETSIHLTPEFFAQTLKFVYLHGRHLSKYLSTYYSPNTHLTGEALGLYYLGTQFRFFKAARSWRETGAEILFQELDRQILPDGVYFEQSTWYQRYTADFYTHFLILNNLNGDQTDQNLQLKLGAKLQSLVDFLMAATRPDGTTPLIGDDDGGRLLPLGGDCRANDFRAVLTTNAVLFERGDFKSAAGECREETLWLLGAAGADNYESLPVRVPDAASKAFADGGYFVMRDGYAKTDNYLLVDCGELGALSGGHGHADALSINLAVGGRTMLIDSGTYTYHESDAARHYFRSTAAHNTLTIDGESQSEPDGKFSWRTRANSCLKKWIAQERFDFFEGSHDGYERLPAPATHTRGILSLKKDYWIMRDLVETNGAHDYRLNFHFDPATGPRIEQSENGIAFVSEASSASASACGVRLFTFGNRGVWERKTTAVSDCYGRKAAAPLVQFASNGAGTQEFFTFLLPSEPDVPAPQVVEMKIDGGRAFVINFKDYQDLFIFANADQSIRTESFSTDFQFLWARSGAGETAPEEYVLINGTNLTIGSREVINQPSPLAYATARRFGDTLKVQTPDGVFQISLL